jgi:hypothetical protein
MGSLIRVNNLLSRLGIFSKRDVNERDFPAILPETRKGKGMRNTTIGAMLVSLAGCTPAAERADRTVPAVANEDGARQAAKPVTPDSDIQLSPVSPPAEVDPVRNEVGNETPG